jgi:hypothetical protein
MNGRTALYDPERLFALLVPTAEKFTFQLVSDRSDSFVTATGNQGALGPASPATRHRGGDDQP